MKRDRSWFYIAVLTVFVAIFWGVAVAWDKSRQTTIPADVEKIMAPLNSKLDTVILDKLKNKTL